MLLLSTKKSSTAWCTTVMMFHHWSVSQKKSTCSLHTAPSLCLTHLAWNPWCNSVIMPHIIHSVLPLSLLITWPSPKAGQVLKCRRFFIFLGVEMVIGWICSRDLFETSWEGLHEVLTIVIAEESRMFMCVLSLPQWSFFRNFEPLVSHMNVHAGCGRSWRAFLEQFLVEMILTMHTLGPSILA